MRDDGWPSEFDGPTEAWRVTESRCIRLAMRVCAGIAVGGGVLLWFAISVGVSAAWAQVLLGAPGLIGLGGWLLLWATKRGMQAEGLWRG